MKVDRPILKYFGSKWRMATRIIELLGPHISYIEPFGGSAAVLLQKEESPIEVFNDLNHDVVTFFRILRNQPLALLEQIEATPYSREEYMASMEVHDSVTDLERARCFFIRSWQGFSGSATMKRNGWRFQQRIYSTRETKVHLDWHNLERLETASVRLRRVQIECGDALKLMKRFDGPDAVFYIDPPYLSTVRSKYWNKCAYTHELTGQDHIHLLNLVKRLKGRVILSCYESSLYSEHLGGVWEKVQFETVNNRTTKATEILWIKPHAR